MVKQALIALIMLIMLPAAFAASASISQSGADSGTVMQGVAFTLSVTGISGSGTATVTLPSGFTATEETTKSFSGESVSWTTITASSTMSGQTISVLISGTGSPETATTSSFNVISAPSLGLSVSPTSWSFDAGDNTEISVNIRNSGDTTAQNVVALLSLPTGYSTGSTSQTITSIASGASSAVSWDVTAGSSAASGTITLRVSASNADTATGTITTTKNSNGGDDDSGGGSGGSSSGGYAFATPTPTPAPVILDINAGQSATITLSSTPKTKRVAVTGKIEYMLGVQPHSITIKSVTATSATIVVASEPTEVTLLLGEEKKLDVTNDRIEDINVKLVAVNPTANYAELEITLLPAPRPTEPEREKDKEAANTGGPAPLGETLKKAASSTPIIIVGLIVIIGAIIYGVIISVHHHTQKKEPKDKKEEKK